jgi:hypothetical protein
MAIKDFVREITSEWKDLSKPARIRRTKKLCTSLNTREFIQKRFPEFYAEAFPRAKTWEGGSSESTQPHTLYAKLL